MAKFRHWLAGSVALVLVLGPLVPAAAASKIEPVVKPTQSSSLAFTGVNVGLLLMLGAGLVGVGLLLRSQAARATRPPVR